LKFKDCNLATQRVSLLLLLVILAGLVSGCERAPSKETAAPASSAPSSNASNPSATDANSGMLKIPAGRFMMGESSEADSQPHEVSLSAFLLDKNLVTQGQF